MRSIDLSEYDVTRAIRITERSLGLRLATEPAKYGWAGKSAGFRAMEGTWVRLSCRPQHEMNERTWTGEESASVIRQVAKPLLLRSVRWLDDEEGIVWRADELEFVESPVIGETQEIAERPDLTDEWWAKLRTSLSALAMHRTGRVGVRQDLVSRRVVEYTNGAVDPQVEEWATAHADLHWANLTMPQLYILDWEGWGAGPRGLDAATLWAFSLLVPSVARRVQQEFASDLTTRSGKLARLFMCIELLRMVEGYGDHPALKEPLADAANGLVCQLRDDL